MTIGEKIRELRRKRDITQEKLADYLGISFQSVSKWENGTALPDISYVIPLANFFGVTTDELLGRDPDEAILKEYEQKRFDARHRGESKEALAICREVVKRYPNNYKWLENLAGELMSTLWDGTPREERKAAGEEALSICQRIMEDCTDDAIRASCRQTLVMLYNAMGDTKKALEEAEKAPSLYLSSEVLADNIGRPGDPEREERAENTLLTYMDLMNRILIRWEDDTERRIKRLETAVAIWHLLIDDGNFLFYHSRLYHCHKMLAACYANLGNREKMYEHIALAHHHAKQDDEQPQETCNYTADLVKHAVNHPSETTRSFTGTFVECWKKDLQGYPCFAPYREEPEFRALLAKM